MSVETATRPAPATDDLLERFRAVGATTNVLDDDSDTAVVSTGSLRERRLYRRQDRFSIKVLH